MALTLAYGPETFLADRVVRSVVAAARSADPDVDVDEVSASDLAPGALVGLVSPSLFAQRQVLVVRDVQDAGEHLAADVAAVLAGDADGIDLVFVHPGGTKGRAVLQALRAAGVEEVNCERLTRAEDQLRFVQREAAAAGGRLLDEAARLIVETFRGADLHALAGAVAQLVADAEGPVTPEVVSTYFGGHGEVKGFVVADRAVEGRTPQALEQLRWALDGGTAPVLVTSALAAALRGLARLSAVPRGAREADVARDLGVPAWKLRTLRGQLRGWTPEGLSAAIHVVAEADARVKGAGNDPELALSRAIVAIGRARSAG